MALLADLKLDPADRRSGGDENDDDDEGEGDENGEKRENAAIIAAAHWPTPLVHKKPSQSSATNRQFNTT